MRMFDLSGMPTTDWFVEVVECISFWSFLVMQHFESTAFTGIETYGFELV